MEGLERLHPHSCARLARPACLRPAVGFPVVLRKQQHADEVLTRMFSAAATCCARVSTGRRPWVLGRSELTRQILPLSQRGPCGATLSGTSRRRGPARRRA